MTLSIRQLIPAGNIRDYLENKTKIHLTCGLCIFFSFVCVYEFCPGLVSSQSKTMFVRIRTHVNIP